MSQSVEFFYDYGSPASYLAFYRLLQLEKQYQLQIVYRPMLLGGVFKTIGNKDPASVPAKGLYLFTDFQRYAQRYGVTFRYNPHFPVNTLALMRAAVSLVDHPAALHSFNKLCFDAMWKEPQNMADPQVVGALLAASDLDAAGLFAATQNPAIKEDLKKRTQEAVDKGVFGAPTMFFNGQMYWGQDRIFMIVEQLESAVADQ